MEGKEEFNLSEREAPMETLLFTFDGDKDLRDVHTAIVLHPVSRFGELGLIKFKNRRNVAYRKLDELLGLGLIKFLSVMDIRDKKLKGEKLNKEEEEVLEKFKGWSKTMTDKQKKMYLSKTNYYTPTEKGLDKQLLYFLMNKKKEIKQVTKELFLFSNRVKGFNFIKEIKKIAVNKREEQVISLVEEKFEEFIRLLKDEVGDFCYSADKEDNIAIKRELKEIINKLAGRQLVDE